MIHLRHVTEFLLLGAVFLIGLFIFFTVTSVSEKRLVALVLALIYPIWGIWHHRESHNYWHLNIFLEYSLVGLIVLVALLSIT